MNELVGLELVTERGREEEMGGRAGDREKQRERLREGDRERE